MSRFDDLSDSKEGRRRRQQKRRDALKAIAQRAGFRSWYKLETAVINGQSVTIGDKTMSKKNLLQRVKKLVKTTPYPHNETNIEEWIDEGDCDDMTAEEIAREWDEVNSQD